MGVFRAGWVKATRSCLERRDEALIASNHLEQSPANHPQILLDEADHWRIRLRSSPSGALHL